MRLWCSGQAWRSQSAAAQELELASRITLLPWICDQLWFSMRIIKTVWIAAHCVV
jgi:hypothetical protein